MPTLDRGRGGGGCRASSHVAAYPAELGSARPMPDLGLGGTSRLVGAGGNASDIGTDLDRDLSFPSLPAVSFQENVKGADAGPADTICMPGDELPLALFEPSFSLLSLDPSSPPGKGADWGSFVECSMASAESVRRCLVGLRPVRGRYVDDGGARFLETSF